MDPPLPKSHPDYAKTIKRKQRSLINPEQLEKINLERREKYKDSKDTINQKRRAARAKDNSYNQKRREARAKTSTSDNQKRRTKYAMTDNTETNRKRREKAAQQKAQSELVLGRMDRIREDPNEPDEIQAGVPQDNNVSSSAFVSPSVVAARKPAITPLTQGAAASAQTTADQTPLTRATLLWQASARKLQKDEDEIDKIDDEELQNTEALIEKETENENYARNLARESSQRFNDLKEAGKLAAKHGEESLKASRVAQDRRLELFEKMTTLKRNKALRTAEKSRRQEQLAREHMEHEHSLFDRLSSHAKTPSLRGGTCASVNTAGDATGDATDAANVDANVDTNVDDSENISKVLRFADKEEEMDESFQSARSSLSSPSSVMMLSPIPSEKSPAKEFVPYVTTNVGMGLSRFGERCNQQKPPKPDPLLSPNFKPEIVSSPPPLVYGYRAEKTVVDKALDAQFLNPSPYKLLDWDVFTQADPNETRSFGMLEDDLSVLDDSWMNNYGSFLEDTQGHDAQGGTNGLVDIVESDGNDTSDTKEGHDSQGDIDERIESVRVDSDTDDTLVESDTDEDHTTKSYLFYKGRYWCPPGLIKATGSQLSEQQRADLTQGINFVNAGRQELVMELVRKLLGMDFWGRNQECLHDITLFCMCRKLGFKTTQGKTRAVMLSKLREVRDPEWVAPGEPRGWSMPKDYSQNFG